MPKKTIEVDEKVYDFLMALSKNMNEQDNRATASPYGLIIVFDEDRPTAEGLHHDYYYSYGGEEITEGNFNDLYIDYVRDCIQLKEVPLIIEDWIDENIERTPKARFKEVTSKFDCNYFLTEKAGREHLDRNRHNLPDNARLYGIHNYRNDEMEQLQDFLRSLTKKEQ